MVNPFQFETDAEAKRVLKQEGRRLEQIAKKVWNGYLGSYSPKMYVRTGKSQKSIKLNNVFRVDENTWGIELTFQNDLTYHDSVFGKSQPKGHSIMLISSGWKVRKGWHKKIHRFGYYGGFDYLGKVIKEFNNGKHKGIELEVQWSGNYTK